jgi:hypothetical protein
MLVEGKGIGLDPVYSKYTINIANSIFDLMIIY